MHLGSTLPGIIVSLFLYALAYSHTSRTEVCDGHVLLTLACLIPFLKGRGWGNLFLRTGIAGTLLAVSMDMMKFVDEPVILASPVALIVVCATILLLNNIYVLATYKKQSGKIVAK